MERRDFIFVMDPGVLFYEEILDPDQAMKAANLVPEDARIRVRETGSGEEP
jgi:hypothetical protein